MIGACVVRAARLGFDAEMAPAGPVFVRAEAIALGVWLDALGVAPLRQGTVALDIEAVSLAGGHLAAFLVGVGICGGTELLLEQFLLADVSGELALLEAVAARARGAPLLTYNGRGFDMRVLASRCVANGLHPSAIEPRSHDDLLAATRRHFRHRLRSCTLAEVEAAVLGVFREDDVSGHEGPARYCAWLRGAPSHVMASVVRHNRMDVLVTALLGAHLAALGEPLPALPPVHAMWGLTVDRA